MKILRNNELTLAICFCLSASGMADPASGKPKPVSSDMKSFCEAFYMLQEVYQSENGSYAPSFEALETKQNIQLPSLSGGYKPRLKAGQSMYRVFFASPGKDTLVLSSSGQLKRGKEVLLALARPEERNRTAAFSPKPKRKPANVAEVPKEPHRSPTQVNRVEDSAAFVINGIKYRVVKTLARMDSKSGMDETVEGIRILNPEDSICHRESWVSSPGQDGFESTRQINSVRLIGSNGEGLLFVYDYSPAAPPSGTAFRILGAGKSCLVPLSKEIPIFGYVSGWYGKDSTLKLENDVLEIEVWTGRFGAVVPFKVDLVTDTKEKSRFTLASGVYDGKVGFLFLRVNTQIEKDYYQEGAAIDLSSGFQFNATERVIIPLMEKVEVIGVNLRVPENILVSPAEILDIVESNRDSMNVKVRLNGKTGWIKVDGMSKLGFPLSG